MIIEITHDTPLSHDGLNIVQLLAGTRLRVPDEISEQNAYSLQHAGKARVVPTGDDDLSAPAQPVLSAPSPGHVAGAEQLGLSNMTAGLVPAPSTPAHAGLTDPVPAAPALTPMTKPQPTVTPADRPAVVPGAAVPAALTSIQKARLAAQSKKGSLSGKQNKSLTKAE